MNDIEIKEELLSINAKVDHIGRIVSELFVITKSYVLYDKKFDICITSLNNLSYKVEQIEKMHLRLPLQPPPLQPPPIQPPPIQSTISSPHYPSSSSNIGGSNILYLDELKKKLEERRNKLDKINEDGI